MTYRILITGTREELSSEEKHKINTLLAKILIIDHPHDDVVIVHGDCPTGVDNWVSGFEDDRTNVTIERHPADWVAHGRYAGPIRNQEMVDLGADICLAFPKGESRGTRGCAKLAQEAGIPTIITEL